MASVGLEPTCPCGHGILSPARLPFHHEAEAVFYKNGGRLKRRLTAVPFICRRDLIKLEPLQWVARNREWEGSPARSVEPGRCRNIHDAQRHGVVHVDQP